MRYIQSALVLVALLYSTTLVAQDEPTCIDATDTTSLTACNNYYWHDSLYSASGIYTYRIEGVAAEGCDSVKVLILTLGFKTDTTIEHGGCGRVVHQGTTYTIDTIIGPEILQTTLGCDSLIFTRIRIFHNSPEYRDTVIGCDSIKIGRNIYRHNDNRSFTRPNSNGCDSIIRQTILIHHSSHGVLDTSVCDSLVLGASTFYEPTSLAFATIINHEGCDSIIRVTINEIKNNSNIDTSADVCDVLVWRGQTLTTSGTYLSLISSNNQGCDSLNRIFLTVRHSTNSDTALTTCDSAIWNDTIRRMPGLYPMRLPINNAVGCDTTLVLDLFLLHKTYGDTVATTCDSMTWHGQSLYDNVRTATTVIDNQVGCDSIVTLHLTVLHGSRRSEYAEASGFFIWRDHRVEEDGDIADTLVGSNGCDSVVVLHLTLNARGEGSLNGVFEIADSHLVTFSMGNLQYLASSDLWRFAPRQYDYAGQNNAHASDSSYLWIDLFGWATSGYHNPTDTYNRFFMPYSTLSSNVAGNNSHGYGPSVNSAAPNLDSVSTNYDWGMFCSITNGGNAAGQWRTLSHDEWRHLLFERPDAAKKRAMANVAGINGLVLLPESWILPEDCSFVSGNNNGFQTNTYSPLKWISMESAGAVFLPTAGIRYDTVVSALQQNGQYWSITHRDQQYAYVTIIEQQRVSTEALDRSVGRAVRLVKDVDKVDLPCATYGDTCISAVDSLVWYNQTFRTSGEYIHTLSNANAAGCDSNVVLHLNIHGPRTTIGNTISKNFKAYANGRNIIVEDATQQSLNIYDVTGRKIVVEDKIPSSHMSYQINMPGVYMIKVGDAPARKVVIK